MKTIVLNILRSFYKKSFYQEVLRSWQGWGIVWVTGIVLLVSTPLFLRWVYLIYGVELAPAQTETYHYPPGSSDLLGSGTEEVSLLQRMNAELSHVLMQLPLIKVTHGEISIDEPEPFVIDSLARQMPLVVIDTTGNTKLKLATYPESLKVFVDKNALWIRIDQQDFWELPLSETVGTTEKPFIIDQVTLMDWWKTSRTLIVLAGLLIILPIMVAMRVFYLIAQTIICVGIGLVIAQILKLEIPFKAMFRLGMIATTPFEIALMLFSFTPFGIFLTHNSMTFIVSMGYLTFGLMANRPKSHLTH